jgi:hypothetical protein
METRRHGVRIEEGGEPGQRRVDRNGCPAWRLRRDPGSLFRMQTLRGYARSSVRALSAYVRLRCAPSSSAVGALTSSKPRPIAICGCASTIRPSRVVPDLAEPTMKTSGFEEISVADGIGADRLSGTVIAVRVYEPGNALASPSP